MPTLRCGWVCWIGSGWRWLPSIGCEGVLQLLKLHNRSRILLCGRCALIRSVAVRAVGYRRVVGRGICLLRRRLRLIRRWRLDRILIGARAGELGRN